MRRVISIVVVMALVACSRGTAADVKPQAAPAAAAAPVVLVPRESVVTRDGKPTVFLVREGRAQAQAIVLGTERQGRVIVKEGLSGGETLVLRPKDDLKDGAAVKVKGQG